jgi:hypothetical protein
MINSNFKNFHYSGADISSLIWINVHQQYKKGHSNILALVDLVLSLPAASSDAERGFSELKMTKTDWRCSLRSNVLNDLLTIHFNTPSIGKYDPLPAIQLWNSSVTRKRRPNYMENSDDEDCHYEVICYL